LWIRHMAEVIRRAFEEAHEVQWPEEDQAFGRWLPGGRVWLFGSERPFDDPLRSKPFIAHQFGLFTGSALRWYVEGDTEYYAVLRLLVEPSRLGVELVNLRGEIADERRSAARKLDDALREDLALSRLSVISFDRDVKANERAIRRQVKQDHVVGLINTTAPPPNSRASRSLTPRRPALSLRFFGICRFATRCLRYTPACSIRVRRQKVSQGPRTGRWCF